MLKRITIIIYILSFIQFAHGKELDTSFKFKQLDKFNLPDDIPVFDIDGKKHFFEEYEGKTILLAFWATWCAPCTNEMVDLELLQKDFRKLNFVILPISEDYAGIEVVKKFYDSYDLRHLLLLHDYKNTLFKELGMAGMPISILINADGQAVGMFTGNVPWHDEKVREILLSNITGNPATPKNTHKDTSLNQKINIETEKIQEPALEKTTNNEIKTDGNKEKLDDKQAK